MVKEKEELEPTLDVETAPFMEPNSELICKIPGTGASKDYWQAQRLASSMHREFEELQEAGDEEGMRERFYVLARYYGRTLNILRSALSRGNEELVNTALHNIIALHEPMHHMHDLAPETVPFVITLDRETRGRLTEDIVVELLQDSSKALSFSELRERVNSRHFMVRISESRLRGHLDNLSERGHIIVKEDLYQRSNLAYSGINMDTFSLRALLGSKIYQEFDKEGYNRLSSIVNRKKAFLQFFQRFSGCSSEMGELFIAVALELTSLEHTVPEAVRWDHVDLNGSQIPRPYQRLIYSIFRAYGYQGQVVEAPTGSGKTLIGMMVIQNWLRSLSRGQSILVLVPTVNYEQQWLRELCYKPIGLQLPPNEVFIGTPSALDEKKNKGLSHSILVLTYTALAQIGSPRGKGGFDSTSIERFIQGNNIQYVILDEVHKAVDDLESVTANVARLLSEWLRDGSIRGLIGFSGTAAAYRERFRDLGLQLVYTLPSADLIAYGFVAPFAEFGVPFAYSDREKRVRDLIEEYKVLMKEFLGLVGDRKLIELFSKVDPKLRVEIARDLLGMYSGRGDQEAALRERFTEWEQADELTLNELPLVSIVQLAESIPDEKLVSGSKEFGRIHSRLMEIREKLDERIFYEDISSRLQAKGFGKTLDAESALELPGKVKYKSAVREQSKDILASSIVGLYGSLKSFYYRVGEGRVDSISTIIEAERQVRYISGVIVFDRGRRIKWEKGTVNQGYSGVAGLFAHMLGDLEHIPMAVLSSEIYLPHREETSIPGLIAGFIKEELMMGKMGETIFRHLTRGMEETEDLRKDFNRILRRYVETLSKVGSARRSEFQRRVLNRLASNIRRKHMDEGTLERLDVKNLHLRSLVNTFYDYAMIADRFTNAHEAMLRLTSGEVQRFYVVKMASGDRKVLMYDLAARIVDSESLPINVIIVSTWARTGWNVIKPNLLIDATATRNVTAWQQLRGRAMRARASWNKEAYETMMALLGSEIRDLEQEIEDLPDDVELYSGGELPSIIDDSTKELLLDVNGRRGKLASKIKAGTLEDITEEERRALAVKLMTKRNKVTHIYELVKAYGSPSQVRYNREMEAWGRKESIAAKHNFEYSVNPFTGEYSSGEVHAPLLYIQDPRENLPSMLGEYLTERLKGLDSAIVEGWMNEVLSEREWDQ